MNTPSSAGLREVRLRYSIRRLHLVTGSEMEPGMPYYQDKGRAYLVAENLNSRIPKILHTVEEVELKPED